MPRPGRSVYTCQISIQGQEFIVANAPHFAHTGVAWISRECVPIILLNKWLNEQSKLMRREGLFLHNDPKEIRKSIHQGWILYTETQLLLGR